MKTMLVSADFDESLATDGQHGVDQFREQRLDLVLSDIVMPRKERLQSIRDMSPSMPTVAMSAGTLSWAAGCRQDVASDALIIAEHLGAARTISKPFSREPALGDT